MRQTAFDGPKGLLLALCGVAGMFGAGAVVLLWCGALAALVLDAVA